MFASFTYRLAIRLSLAGFVVVVTGLARADDPQPTARGAEAPPEGVVKEAAQLFLGTTLTANAYLATNSLGIEVTPVDETLRAQLHVEGGLVITKAPEGSEGANAGLQAHDVILNINGPRSEAVHDAEKLAEILNNNAGKNIEIGLLRGGKMQLITVPVPQPQEIAFENLDETLFNAALRSHVNAEHYRIGVTLAEADETLRSQLRLATGEGLIVTEVIAGSPAEKVGVKQHDVLVELDGKRLTSVQEITNQIQEIKARKVNLELIRGGKQQAIEVTPEKDTNASAEGATFSQYVLLNAESRLNNLYTLTVQPRMLLHQGNGVFLTLPATSNTAITLDHMALDSIGTSNAGDPLAQLNALKSQLAQMQQLVTALEASLKKPDQPDAPPPSEEKK